MANIEKEISFKHDAMSKFKNKPLGPFRV